MRILLIRHAEPDYLHDSITEKGRREALLLSERISRYNIRDFFVSPLGRARDTASYTLQKTGRTAETLDWLQEFRGKYPDPETGKLRLAWDLDRIHGCLRYPYIPQQSSFRYRQFPGNLEGNI